MEGPSQSEKNLIDHTMEAVRFTHLFTLFHKKVRPPVVGDRDSVAEYSSINRRILKFTDDLRYKYGKDEVYKTKLFHILAQSSGASGIDCPRFDFEEIDQETGKTKHLIEDFIKSL